MAKEIFYLNLEKARLYRSADTNSKVLCELLWGDRIEVDENAMAPIVKVKARGRTGYVERKFLGKTALLEFYFIDVGQGDAVLIVTPDRKHILIDGGYNRSKQPHGKSAADFVDWKFDRDYGMNSIDLDVMIASHCDADHYGGLWDLLAADKNNEMGVDSVSLKHFYHAGVSWWKDANHKRFLGRESGGYLHDLLQGKIHLRNSLKPNAQLRLQGEWAKFLKMVSQTNCTVDRLAHNPHKGFKYLPGFDPVSNDVSIKILGPIEYEVNNAPKLKDLGGQSKNTNGNSILLRIGYGRTRTLLTGDLNKKSQHLLLNVYQGMRQEFSADVAKSCHHGSDDCSYEFLENVKAGATIISSGDDETHAHPRPNIVAASAQSGYRIIENDEMITPLIFSTEISRSYRLGDPYQVDGKFHEPPVGPLDVSLIDKKKTNVRYNRTRSGAVSKSKRNKSLNKLRVVDGIVYGLVNVRTDGNKILCATLNEGKSKWEIKSFNSRF